MEKFYIITNSLKDKNLHTTLMIQKFLKEKGKECLVQQDKLIDGKLELNDLSAIPKDIECAIVVGGDGTLIQAARDLTEWQIPLLGVNMGTLGYLVEIEVCNVLEALEKVLDGHYEIEERMMLDGIVYKEGKEVFRDTALNDIVVSRSGTLRILNYNISVNEKFLNCYGADGMIISTPTGSTGYNLSAGGPIVEPTASMIMITPICSHALNTRSIVLAGRDEVKLEVGRGRRVDVEHAFVCLDGRTTIELQTGDFIVVKQSERKTKLIKINKLSFLETLRKKMSRS